MPHGISFPADAAAVYGLRLEERFPIVEILRRRPPIPENCQWALFLRNHDELTLEMVTDEERDYMYRVYAPTSAAASISAFAAAWLRCLAMTGHVSS